MSILPKCVLFQDSLLGIEDSTICGLKDKLQRNLCIIIEGDAVLKIDAVFTKVCWITEWEVDQPWEGVLCCLKEIRGNVLGEVHYELAGLGYQIEFCC